MSTVLQRPPAQPVVRLRLAPHDFSPRRVDGAWWPRSRDLLVELPLLLGALPPAWGQVDAASVHEDVWSPSPRRLLIAGHLVQLRREPGARNRHTICLLSSGRGRRDLLVVPPEVAGSDAERLMAAVAAQAC